MRIILRCGGSVGQPHLASSQLSTRDERDPHQAPQAPSSANATLGPDQHHTRHLPHRDFKTRAGDANSSLGSPKHKRSKAMKTHGPYNSTTTIIKIDNELKQEDTAALSCLFLLPFCLHTVGHICLLRLLVPHAFTESMYLPIAKNVLRER